MGRLAHIPVALTVAGALTACGSSQPTAAHTTTTATTAAGPGALQAEATAAAAGDIPDNQVFLAFDNSLARYSIKFPEGWAQQGSGSSVVFRDKNNVVRIVVGAGGAPTKTTVQADVARLKGAHVVTAPATIRISGRPAIKVVYSTESAANAVTGKRVVLIVARYYLWTPGRRAVVDLGSPQGVDNVDAYRLMIESFRWR